MRARIAGNACGDTAKRPQGDKRYAQLPKNCAGIARLQTGPTCRGGSAARRQKRSSRLSAAGAVLTLVEIPSDHA